MCKVEKQIARAGTVEMLKCNDWVEKDYPVKKMLRGNARDRKSREYDVTEAENG